MLKSCLDFLKAKNIFCFRVNNTGIFDPNKKVYRSFHGTKGVSDIICILPTMMAQNGVVGRLGAIEVKTPRGRVSKAQEAFLQDVDDSGGLAMVVTSVDDLEKFLAEEGF